MLIFDSVITGKYEGLKFLPTAPKNIIYEAREKKYEDMGTQMVFIILFLYALAHEGECQIYVFSTFS